MNVIENQAPLAVDNAVKYTDKKLKSMDSKFARLSNLINDEDLEEFPRIAALLKQGKEMADTIRKENKNRAEKDQIVNEDEECSIESPTDQDQQPKYTEDDSNRFIFAGAH